MNASRVDHRIWQALFALVMFSCTHIGCASRGVDLTVEGTVTTGMYSTDLWRNVLENYVRIGAVDYRTLAHDRADLDRFAALLGDFGPNTHPSQFPDRGARVAYYLNAYNACVIRAVIAQGIPESVHTLEGPDLNRDFIFRLDGQTMNLAQMRQAVIDQSAGDARPLLCMCDGAKGSPPLFDRPFQGRSIEQDLADAARRAMDFADMVSIDHENRRLLLSIAIFENQPAFIEYVRAQQNDAAPTILNALIAMASTMRGQWLEQARGYAVAAIPFNPALNQSGR